MSEEIGGVKCTLCGINHFDEDLKALQDGFTGIYRSEILTMEEMKKKYPNKR